MKFFKILLSIAVFVLGSLFSYFCWATITGLMGTLVKWDISFLLRAWQFWRPDDGMFIQRIICWTLSIVSSLCVAFNIVDGDDSCSAIIN